MLIRLEAKGDKFSMCLPLFASYSVQSQKATCPFGELSPASKKGS